jgi:flagellar motor switch protein FliN/FliY
MTNEANTHWVIEAWQSELSRVLELLTLERPEISVETLPASAAVDPAPDSICLEHKLSVGNDSRIWVQAPSNVWHALGERTLRAAGIENSSDDDQRDAWRELVAQAASALAQAVGQRLGWQSDCSQVGPCELPAQPAFQCMAEIALGQERLAPLVLQFSAGFAGVLTETAEEEEEEPQEQAVERPSDNGRFAMLSDVELPLSVSFGRTFLPIRDVLKLSTGSLIELNRLVNDFVDIVVNNCVIARGEVVVVDGNYGVRIHEIVSRQERLNARHIRGGPSAQHYASVA